MSNPYEAPADHELPAPTKPLPPPQPRGLVGHVHIVAILMIVQGVLELLLAVNYFLFGVLFGAAFGDAIVKDPNFRQAPGAPPELMSDIMTATPIVMGCFGVAVGLLHVYAGCRNFLFQNRTLGIIALVGGLASIVTVYCCPTSFLLCIYGGIVYLNDSVMRAFVMGGEGFSSEAILFTFSGSRYNEKKSD